LSGRPPSGRISIQQRLRPVPFRHERLRALVRKALARVPHGTADLRVLVVDDADMIKWNNRFLNRPWTTNVLSFPDEEPQAEVPVALAGDILISAPTCLKQTRGWKGSPEERVLFFIVHGLLHLAGYDHERGGAAARRMRRTEMDVYRSAVGARPGRARR
jgi:probable rRNA maturation factor